MSAEKEFVIRDATPADAEAIIHMHAKSWLNTYPNREAGVTREWVKNYTSSWFSEERVASRRERLQQALDSPDMLYRIAIGEGEIIGMIRPVRDEKEQRVGGIYVDNSYHGSGLGSKLMDEIIAWSDPQRPLEVEVADYNECVKHFYGKYGFEELEGSKKVHKSSIPIIRMIRKGDK